MLKGCQSLELKEQHSVVLYWKVKKSLFRSVTHRFIISTARTSRIIHHNATHPCLAIVEQSDCVDSSRIVSTTLQRLAETHLQTDPCETSPSRADTREVQLTVGWLS